jgi:hypothetical protein
MLSHRLRGVITVALILLSTGAGAPSDGDGNR